MEKLSQLVCDLLWREDLNVSLQIKHFSGMSIFFISSPPLKVILNIGKWIPNRLEKLHLLPSYSEVFLDCKEKLALLWDFEREEPSLSNK